MQAAIMLKPVLAPGSGNLCCWISGRHSKHWCSSSCWGLWWHWWRWGARCQWCCWTRWWRRWSCGNRSSSCCRCSRSSCRWWRWSCCCWSRSCCSWGCCWFGPAWSKLDLEKLNSRLNCAAILNQQLCDDSRSRGGHRHRSLVRLNLAENLVL